MSTRATAAVKGLPGVVQGCGVFLLASLLLFDQAFAGITVHVRGEAPIVAEVAAWRPYEQVLVVFVDGGDRLLAAHKVLKILDQNGADRTRFLIYGRGVIGEYPEAYQGSRKAMTSNFRPLLVIAGMAVGVALLLGILIATSVHSGTNQS